MRVKQHYEEHLADHYSWMFGDFNNKVAENKSFFLRQNILPKGNKIALDMGSGSGFQSIALAQLGFSVKAVDFSSKMLKALKSLSKALDIETFEADFLNVSKYATYSPELIVCMGDTITLLENKSQVKELLNKWINLLEPEGKIVLSFRDLNIEMQDEQRFIPVRSDDTKVFTCFLEYFPDFVKVFDIVHEKENGAWKQKVSYYQKLKLTREEVEKILLEAGMSIVVSEMEKGFAFLVGQKK